MQNKWNECNQYKIQDRVLRYTVDACKALYTAWEQADCAAHVAGQETNAAYPLLSSMAQECWNNWQACELVCNQIEVEATAAARAAAPEHGAPVEMFVKPEEAE